jgi:hypothetical protein
MAISTQEYKLAEIDLLTQSLTDPTLSANMLPLVSDYGSPTPSALTNAAERERFLLAHLPSVRFVARRIHERIPGGHKGELRQCLIDTIHALPERDRLVLTLHYFEKLTIKEISMTLRVGETRVSQVLAAAVLMLRAAVADLGVEPSVASKKRLRATHTC